MEPIKHITAQMDEGKITLTADPRLAVQFRTKAEASKAAKAIGWFAKDATEIEVLGFRLWTISDDHCRFLTRTGYAYAAHLRGIDSGWTPPKVTSADIAAALAN